MMISRRPWRAQRLLAGGVLGALSACSSSACSSSRDGSPAPDAGRMVSPTPVRDGGGGAGGGGGISGTGGASGQAGSSAGEGGSAGQASAGAAGQSSGGAAGSGSGGNPAGEAGGGGEAPDDIPDAGLPISGQDGTTGGDGDPGNDEPADAGHGGGGDPNYVSRGEWFGYTFSTADGASAIAHEGTCASGFSALDPELEAEPFGAAWTWNVQQLESAESGEPWSPTSQRISVDVSTTFDEPVQLIMLDEAFNSWCVPLAGGPEIVRWTDLRETCGGGAAFDGITGIYAVGILVPPGTEEPQPFDFCVETLAPLPDATDAGAPIPSGDRLDAGGADTPDASAPP